ncbi:MAG TPA: DUF4416 family protein [Spirochaetota bacterium]
MAEPIIPVKAKLFIGVISGDERLVHLAGEKFARRYGRVDLSTARIPFTHTDYYNKLGANLYRVFFSFEKMIRREDIVAIKLHTNALEIALSGKGERKINIDPGYLTLSNVFLASCKEYFHRTYLGKGIYLENEYKYIERSYRFWDWTYPDYKKKEYLDYFHNLRQIYYSQIQRYL